MNLSYSTFRYLAYSIEITVIFVISLMPRLLPEIAGGRPVLLIPLALTIAVFEGETASAVFGAVCGLLTDAAGSNTIGFFALLLVVICYFTSFLSANYIKVRFSTVMFSSFLLTAGIISLHFLFFFILSGYPDGAWFFVNHYISRIIYTSVFIPVFYLLNRLLSQNLREA